MDAGASHRPREEQMSLFTDALATLADAMCKACNGSGSCNDAEPGDIYWNTWECTFCKGSGLSRVLVLQERKT